MVFLSPAFCRDPRRKHRAGPRPDGPTKQPHASRTGTAQGWNDRDNGWAAAIHSPRSNAATNARQRKPEGELHKEQAEGLKTWGQDSTDTRPARNEMLPGRETGDSAGTVHLEAPLPHAALCRARRPDPFLCFAWISCTEYGNRIQNYVNRDPVPDRASWMMSLGHGTRA